MKASPKSLLAVLRGARQERPPLWLMRQAGRYLPEYRALRETKGGFLELCYDPEAAAEVTLQPIRRFGFDGSILFSDILIVPHALGQKLWFEAGEGPRLAPPLVDSALASLEAVPARLDPIYATVARVAAALPVETTFLGFAGSPWTVATYMVAGQGSKDQAAARRLAFGDPAAFQAIVDAIVDVTVTYLAGQIEHGVEAVQLFDSWVGALSPRDFKKYVLPVIENIFDQLKDLPFPKIYYPGVASGELLPLLGGVKADVIGLDWRVPIPEGRRRLDGRFGIQGNLDPYVLTAPMDVIREQALAVLDEGMEKPGYIFNLGHGLFPEASIDKLKELTEFIHCYTAGDGRK